MKTNQEMVRQMGNLEVIQRTVDGYFNATRLVKLWNERTYSEAYPFTFRQLIRV